MTEVSRQQADQHGSGGPRGLLVGEKRPSGSIDAYPFGATCMFIGERLCRDGLRDAEINRSAVHGPLALKLLGKREHDVLVTVKQLGGFRPACLDQCSRRSR
jgi:hypothetical protein